MEKKPTPPQVTPKLEKQFSLVKAMKSVGKLESTVGSAQYPVVPIREGILFPGTESVLTFGRQVSIKSIQHSIRTQNQIILVTQKNSVTDDPMPKDLYTVGTLAVIERTLRTNGQLNALVRGVSRVRLDHFTQLKPNLVATVTKLDDIYEKPDKIRAMAKHLQKEFRNTVHMGKPVEFLNFMKLMSGVTDGELVDQIASTLDISTEQQQKLLEILKVNVRLEKVIDLLAKERKVLEIEKDVASKTQKKFDKNMRESVLRERLRTIQKELGEVDETQEMVSEYEAQMKKKPFPNQEIKQKVAKEISRLKAMSSHNPEAGYVRTWLDLMFELPWKKSSRGRASLKKAEQVLDQSHHGLKEVKDRVLEYIAVLQLKQKRQKKSGPTSPTILCFVGPPGVGKTSIGRSIAESLGRKFVKVSLGGIRDEAEIRGHRRTYVGAMPGRIISGIKQAGTLNPIFMLDEVDKIGNDFRGDPSAALLEALDPEQNVEFSDHYLDCPFDLSKVLFITTANTLDTIPPALKDRLEVVRYAGYTQEEKFQIGKKHLLKKVRENNGLDVNQVKIQDTGLEAVIARYTREAGVRDLERNLNKILRKVARKIAQEKTQERRLISQGNISDYLGPYMYDPAQSEVDDQVGLAAGLAWTSVGGEVLFVEVALSPGKGKIQLTGKLGEVMKESAQAALTYVRANAKKLGISQKTFDSQDVHIHVPEGAVPKDGPSAGVTMATAVASAFTKRPVKKDIAMTGEITLRGRVLRIGGLKEKSIAAHSSGYQTIIIPQDNQRDLAELPDSVKDNVTFIPVKSIDQVFAQALA